MPVQTRLSEAGLAKQSAKGSAETNPEYAFGVLGGTVINADVSEDDLNPTSDSRIVETRERTLVVPGTDYEAVAMSQSIGLMLLGACGSVSTTGTGPYTHTFTTADDLPYLTAAAKYGGEFYRVQDAKIDELTLSWDDAGAAQVATTALGIDVLFDEGTAYTATTTEKPNDPLRPVGGTMNVDGAGAKVQSAEITVTNNLEAVDLSDSVLADDVFPGMQGVEVSLTVVPDNLDEWQTRLTGSATGTDISDDVNFGSVDLNLSNDGGDTLQFTASELAFMATMPDADPDGGPAEVELEGIVTQPSTGDEFQFVLSNGVSAY